MVRREKESDFSKRSPADRQEILASFVAATNRTSGQVSGLDHADFGREWYRMTRDGVGFRKPADLPPQSTAPTPSTNREERDGVMADQRNEGGPDASEQTGIPPDGTDGPDTDGPLVFPIHEEGESAEDYAARVTTYAGLLHDRYEAAYQEAVAAQAATEAERDALLAQLEAEQAELARLREVEDLHGRLVKALPREFRPENMDFMTVAIRLLKRNPEWQTRDEAKLTEWIKRAMQWSITAPQDDDIARLREDLNLFLQQKGQS